jgi:S1-C subfamily serine protease
MAGLDRVVARTAAVLVAACVFGLLMVSTMPNAPADSDAAAAVVAGISRVRVPDEAKSRLEQATVLVRATGCDEGLVGSGVILKSGDVLTNRHVLGGSTEFEVAGPSVDWQRLDGTVSSEEDVAVGPLGGASGGVSGGVNGDFERVGLSFADDDPDVGAVVGLAGHPQGGDLRMRAATVEGYRDGIGPLDPPTILRLDVDVVHGESGSPVVDTAGHLVGIVYASEHGTGNGLVIPVSHLRLALETQVRPSGC